MSAENKTLIQDANGIFAPQHYNATADKYEAARGEDGAAFVKVVPNNYEEFTFTNEVTALGTQTYTNVDAKRVVLTIAGTASAASVTAKLVSFGAKLPVQGFRETTPLGFVETFGINSMITIDKPAGAALELTWTAPTGGNLTIKAVVTSE